MITFNSSSVVACLKNTGHAIKKQFIKVTSILAHLASVTVDGTSLKRKQPFSCQTEKPVISFMNVLSRNKSQNQTAKYQTSSLSNTSAPVLDALQHYQKKFDVKTEPMIQNTKTHYPQGNSKQPSGLNKPDNNKTFKFMTEKNTDTENLLKPTRVAPAIPPIQLIDDLVKTISMTEKSKQETLASVKPRVA